ncbi:MAG: glycerophosphodiester phosphodiesterase family protein [Planctomycetia bacterium]|nr:glycerophosphodiester phosphodiesterase family protein [Planctomycetia bacterium]
MTFSSTTSRNTIQHAILLLIVLACVTALPFQAVAESPRVASASDWDVREQIPLDQFTIQAHRGFGNFGPEGSDDSFRRAWNLGLVPEADLRTTKDGQIVSFHDATFERILPNEPELKKKTVRDLTLREFKELDVGIFRGEEYAGQHGLSLAEMVELLKQNPSYRLYLDIKDADMNQLARETTEVRSRLIVASTDYNLLLAWKAVAPDGQAILWMGGSEAELSKRLDELEIKHFAKLDQLQIHVSFDAAGKMSPSDEFLRAAGARLRAHNILFQTLIWGQAGADATSYARLMSLGCASFATDYPEETKNAIEAYYAASRQD